MPSYRRLSIALSMTLLLVAACGGSTATPSTPGTPSPAASTPPEPSAVPSGPPSAGATAPPAGAFDPEAVSVYFEVVADRLAAPLAVTHAGDGSGRIFVVEQRGQIRIVRDGELAGDPFLNIGDRITSGGERGLLGLAFHPSYPDDPRLFVNYTDLNGDTVISSFEVGADPDRADAASEVVLLRIDQPYPNHNGGAVAFGPDGYLYISTGDGGSGGDPHDNGQRLDTLLGKILRIDVDGATGDARYAVPPDNPFVDVADAAPEIWLLGLRNPWRMSFDRETGDLWIGDVGQGEWEEVDVARGGVGGLNFGWRRVEGFECFDGDDCDDPSYVMPVTAYGHDLGCSVVGGIVYRGTDQPLLTGGYIYSDWCGGNVWLLDPIGDGPVDGRLVVEPGRGISAIGEDESGEPYATDLDAGELLRIVATPR
jgi:glucose/arabinose dehydrogenase